MAEETILSLLDDIEPCDIDARYLSHATFTRHGYSFKVMGDELQKLIAFDQGYCDVSDVRVFYNYAYMLYDVQIEADYIKARVSRLIDVRWRQ